MNNSRTVIETLIDTVYDSIEGYRRAGETAHSTGLKTVFSNQIDRRRRTLELLNQELGRLGGKVMTKGTMTGALHQLWFKIADAFESGDEAAIERVQEGEQYLAGKFEAALDHAGLDPQTQTVIERALAEIREGESLANQLESADNY